MRRPDDFSATVRRGVRSGSDRLVVHRRATADEDDVLVGFVVSRGVGNAVTRTSVKRRLRHLVAARLGELEPGTRLVVRAQPRAAGATSDVLAESLDRALRATARKIAARTGTAVDG